MTILQMFLTLGWLITTIFASFTLLLFWAVFPKDNQASIEKLDVLKSLWTIAGLVYITATLTCLVLILPGFGQFLVMQKVAVIVLIVLSGPVLAAIAHAALWLGRRRKRMVLAFEISVGDIFRPLETYKLSDGKVVQKGNEYKILHDIGSGTFVIVNNDPEEIPSPLTVSVSEMLNMLLPGVIAKQPTVTTQGQS